ncbi:hypothetical protein QJS10_CPA03g00625 [Acorus calamus]|uniref:La-related protein 6A n=1 Tax=Acorus calamus TaxID=4465 RepID=A0AAV9F5A3_ACOCL|nr:hypothetical protein QJS10_CPA03g00625 [Acorus calamus]
MEGETPPPPPPPSPPPPSERVTPETSESPPPPPPPSEALENQEVEEPSSPSHLEEQASSETPEDHVLEGASPPSDSVSQDSDLRDKIVRQVEYYFSNENLPTDKFLLKFVKKNKGFVPIEVIASFRKMKKLGQDSSQIEIALRTSSQLIISSDKKSVKRLKPLSDSDISNAEFRTVLVENLPDDHSRDNLQRMFGDVGNIKDISILQKGSEKKFIISNKLHALIEYETVEEAENAVATLHDEKNWRSGMQVKLLSKPKGKHSGRQHHKGAIPKKNNDMPTFDVDGDKHMNSSDHHDEIVGKEELDHLSEQGGGRGHKGGRWRRQGYHINGHGDGHAPGGSSTECLSKSAPGPRVPDGTRGFMMGRGKPIIADKSAV